MTTTTNKMGSPMRETIKDELQTTVAELKTFAKYTAIFIIGLTLFIAGFSWVSKHNQFTPILHEETTNVAITVMQKMAVDSDDDLRRSQNFGDFTIIDGQTAKYSFFLNKEQLNEFAEQPTKTETGYADVNLLRRANWGAPSTLDYLGNPEHLIIETAENDKFFGAVFTVTWPIACPQITQEYLQWTCGELHWSFDAATQMLMSAITVTYVLAYIALLSVVMVICEKIVAKCHKK